LACAGRPIQEPHKLFVVHVPAVINVAIVHDVIHLFLAIAETEVIQCLRELLSSDHALTILVIAIELLADAIGKVKHCIFAPCT